jgi:hypothetical protein
VIDGGIPSVLFDPAGLSGVWAALFAVDGRTLSARGDEAGSINYEAFTTN